MQAPARRDPQASKPEWQSGWLHIEPLAQTAALVVTDMQGMYDPASWFDRCPTARDQHGASACCIQRHGEGHTVLVWGVNGIMRLRVPRLRCAAHCSTWLLTRPDAWQLVHQKQQAGELLVRPDLVVLSAASIVTQDAFR